MDNNVIKQAQVKGYENYIAFSDGRVYSKTRNKFIKAFPNKNTGYHQIMLVNHSTYKLHYLHRVIYEAFNGELEKGLKITHIDGDISNNNLSNLQIRKQNYPRKPSQKKIYYFKRYNMEGELMNVYNTETLELAGYKRYSVIAASKGNYKNAGIKTNIYKNSLWKVIKL